MEETLKKSGEILEWLKRPEWPEGIPGRIYIEIYVQILFLGGILDGITVNIFIGIREEFPKSILRKSSKEFIHASLKKLQE